jgi:hypothetical protein
LGQIRSSTVAQAAPKPPPLPDGAQFLTRSFACAAGTRGYKLYVPASAVHGLNGLVLMLHGCNQTPEDFAAGTNMNAIAEANRLLVAYPAQTRANNAASCWNWFNPADQRRDAGEPAILAGLARGSRPSSTFRPGGSSPPDFQPAAPWRRCWAQPIPISSPPSGCIRDSRRGGQRCGLRLCRHARRQRDDVCSDAHGGSGSGPRTIIFHGTADRTVHAGNAERLAAAAGPGRRRARRAANAALPGAAAPTPARSSRTRRAPWPSNCG